MNYEWQNISAEQITKRTETHIAFWTETLDKIAAVETPALQNVLQPLIETDTNFLIESNFLTFFQFVSTDKAVREASHESEKTLDNWHVESAMRRDVYAAFNGLVDRIESGAVDGPPAASEEQRFLEHQQRAYRRAGMHLSDKELDTVKRCKQKINELCSDFTKNLNEEATSYWFGKEQLAGLSDDFFEGREQDPAGHYKVTLKYPDFFAVMDHCSNGDTRRRLATAFSSRCLKENEPLLDHVLRLRHKMATRLGYASYAEYATEIQMVKKPERVDEFLEDLAERLEPAGRAEREELLALKRAEQGSESSNVLENWDIRYYTEKLRQKKHSVDSEEVKQYFPLDHVTSVMHSVYERVLGLRFERDVDASAWHESVQKFNVFDAESTRELGAFYMDLFPRDGKYGHAACWNFRPAHWHDGEREPAVAILVCNFPAPTAGRQGLLTHNDVEVYFHEFGHCMHDICSQARLASFAGTEVETDFVEAPSQMLENWVWEREVLTEMSSHWETGEPLPDKLLDNLVASRKCAVASLNLRQLVFGITDQKLHTAEPGTLSSAEIYAETLKRVAGVDAIPGTNQMASFGHLVGGYGAKYYGYMWSLVFARDMYASRFAKEGLFESAAGRDYRNKVIGRGGSRDAEESLKDFLGREPSNDAFLQFMMEN